jgi:16S rRNA (cytosine1402-N4)-methyltransferase
LTDSFGHTPVLLGPALDALGVRPGGTYVDATAGLGGHSEEILRRSSPDGRLIGLDRDASVLERCRARLGPFGERAVLRHANFARVDEAAAGLVPGGADGVLADLGVSSPQLDEAARGFSLMREGPLDMRMDASTGETAAQYLDRVPTEELEERLREAGEERFARKLARLLVLPRGRWTTTKDLAAAVARAVPRRGRSHPATRVFMALRMAVNDEMGNLREFLRRAPAVLKEGGKLVVISFHSTEDRIVKRFYSETLGVWRQMRPVIKSPLVPEREEMRTNPRSRSAKMRVFVKEAAPPSA